METRHYRSRKPVDRPDTLRSAASGLSRSGSAGDDVKGRDDASPLVLVLGADDRFAMPMAVTLYSALANLRQPRPVLVYVLDGGISSENQQRIRRISAGHLPEVRVEFHKVDAAALEGIDFELECHLTRATFLRLLIPEVVPARHERAIYLDSDMVVEGDLGRLWEAEMGGHAVLAVRDLVVPYVSSRLGLYNWRELGLAPDAPYFNAGLLVMDLRRWREEGIGGRTLRYIREHGGAFNHASDQEGLNAVLAGAWGQLDLRWNLLHIAYNVARFEEFGREFGITREELIRDPHIIHFSWRKKPWHSDCTHPARSRFAYFLKRSGWFTPMEYGRWRLELWPKQTATHIWQFARYKSKPYRLALRRALGVVG